MTQAVEVKRWKLRARLVVLSALCMAGGIITEFLPEAERTRVLAGGLFLGGVAMLVVALMLEPNDGEGGKHRREDED